MAHKTREGWLQAAVFRLQRWFAREEAEIPAVRVSVGFPKGGRKAIGQAWSPKSAEDGVAQVFLHPKMDDPVRVLETLVHELVHVVVGMEHGHKGPFRILARAVGLEGRLTATHAGDELRAFLESLATELGPYPHAKLNDMQKVTQTTRMLKVQCEACGCTIRMTRKWLDDAGEPTCGCGTRMKEQ